jgi:ABC-2 type transport system permease protein
MIRALNIYLALVRVSIRSQLRYKLSTLFNTLAYFLLFWSEYVAILVLFGHFGTLAGWTLPEVVICYGIAHLSYSLSEFLVRGFEFLALLARSGDYDRLLLRPVSTAVQLAGHEFALHRAGRVLQAAVVLGWGIAGLEGRVGPAGGLLILWAIVGGCALFCGLYILQGAVGMRTLQNLEVFNILTNGGPEMAQFPMSIYPRPLRLAFTVVVPLAAVVYYPAITILARPEATSPLLGWLTPAAGLLFLMIALGAHVLAQRGYLSTGS